jgi:hypothetical protein
MQKFVLSTSFILTMLSGFTQKRPPNTWWTIYGQTQLLPGDVYISSKQQSIGYGIGQTLLFNGKEKESKTRWMGLDFNHHYFGRKQIGTYRVFYETFQLSFIARFCFQGTETVTPYLDMSAGLRMMASFTANERTYTGLLWRRSVDFVTALLTKDGNDPIDITDHKIIREFDRFMPTAGIGAGILVKSKQSNKGLSIKASMNFGTHSAYADYRATKTENDTYNYTIAHGSGRFYNLQIGYSFRN